MNGLLNTFSERYRTPGKHRRYSVDMLNEYLEQSRLLPTAES